LDEALTLGIFRALRTKAKAPAMARITRTLFCPRASRRIFIRPQATNGRQTAPQVRQKPAGKYPSAMCMAPALWGTPKARASTRDRVKIPCSFFDIWKFLLFPPRLFCQRQKNASPIQDWRGAEQQSRS